ncbi:MAG TPA: transcriptional regulator [Firmicutes bacterium]|nr:transcriptional regulator [Bacillota bacterium]
MAKVTSDSHMRSSETFRIRLNSLIADLDCSIYEFADKANVSKGVLTRAALYGIIPSVRPLIKIADCLCVSLEYLLGLTDNTFYEPAPSPSTFHIRLAELCGERNVKYSEIGALMPFSANLFYDWQREKTIPSLEYLLALAEYFKVSPDYLLGRTDHKNN